MRGILQPPKRDLTEKESYEEMIRAVGIYCYQAVEPWETEFFRRWLRGVVERIEDFRAYPDAPEKYPAYKELRRAVKNFIHCPELDPSRLAAQRIQIRDALEKAKAAGGFRKRDEKPREKKEIKAK